MRYRTITMALAILSAAVLSAHAQSETSQDYPNRPVTFVVPYAPGGSTDLFARILGQKLEQRLGKPFIIENRPGSGAVTATTQVVRAPADGYTLMMASSTPMALNVTVRKNLPYDPTTDLAPVALIARVPYVLVVNPALPIQSVADLVAMVKAKPGQISYASPGPGTFHHLNAEMFSSLFGLKMINVPYKGTAPALNDLMGGHVAMMFADIPPALGPLATGRVRPLGVTTKERVKAVPDIPPLSEVGIPDYEASSWHMVAMHANTPPEIIRRIHNEIRGIMSDPELIESLLRDGALPQTSPSPEELKTFVRSEIKRWGEIVTKAGIAGTQ